MHVRPPGLAVGFYLIRVAALKTPSQSIEQISHVLFPRCVPVIVLDALLDHEHIPLDVFDNVSKHRAFAWTLLRMLKFAVVVDRVALSDR